MTEKITIQVGLHPTGVAYDETYIWVSSEGSNTVTKLLASTGEKIGEYPVPKPVGILFDGVDIWVSSGPHVIKLSTRTGEILGQFRWSSDVGA